MHYDRYQDSKGMTQGEHSIGMNNCVFMAQLIVDRAVLLGEVICEVVDSHCYVAYIYVKLNLFSFRV